MAETFEVLKDSTSIDPDPQKFKINTYKIVKDRQGNTVEIFDREESISLEQLQVEKAKYQAAIDLIDQKIAAAQAL
jgi:hypothetical protein